MANESPAWIVITIPGDDNAPPVFAAYNREARRSGRLYAERKIATRDAKRRNATIARNERKTERQRERAAVKRGNEKYRRGQRKPFIDAIKRADFQAIGVFGDWLQERENRDDYDLGVRLVEIFHRISNPLRFTKPGIVLESALPHVHGCDPARLPGRFDRTRSVAADGQSRAMDGAAPRRDRPTSQASRDGRPQATPRRRAAQARDESQ